jgi:cation diffusion facilitator CzcD-associated flavoprotein CzcO
VNDIDVAIVGAGPYGLSLAAHLKGLGVEHRMFGTPMTFWSDSMPPGMELKSEGKACDLFDPRGEFSIKDYYDEISRPFVGRVIVPSGIFSAYALEFQRRYAPDVDRRNVAHVSRAGDRFVLRLEDESRLRASRIVVATGIRDYAHIPDQMGALPKEFVTHSVEYGPVDRFAGQKVLVVGGGASAVDLAWALHERGSDVSLVCRQPRIKFHPEPRPRSRLSAVRSPDSPIGGGWDLWFYANCPNLFRHLPEATRKHIVATALGAAPGWFMTDRVPGRVPIFPGLQVLRTEVVKGRVDLTAKAMDGREKTLTADHVVAATGYRVDIKKLPFLDQALKDGVRTSGGPPVLSSNFESSEPGLYFVGAASAATFGPVTRFVAGAGFTVRRLSRRLAFARAPSRSPRMAPSEGRLVKWNGKGLT